MSELKTATLLVHNKQLWFLDCRIVFGDVKITRAMIRWMNF